MFVTLCCLHCLDHNPAGNADDITDGDISISDSGTSSSDDDIIMAHDAGDCLQEHGVVHTVSAVTSCLLV